MVFQMFGVEWVMPRRVVDLLACWNRRVGRNDVNIVWNDISSFFFFFLISDISSFLCGAF
jgi:hypothetical protein